MTNKIQKKVGMLTGISMLIGSIIGSGIYFKNNGVFTATNYSAISTGIAWILASIISLLLAISFAEIGRMKNDSSEKGTSMWIKKLLPKHMAKTLSPLYALFYFAAYALVLAYLASKFFVDTIAVYGDFDVDKVSPAVHMLIAVIFTLSLLAGHYFERKVMSSIQVVSSILKLIPLIVMIIAGLALFNTHNFSPSAKDVTEHPEIGKNLFSVNKSFDFNNVLIALPMILFAFDAFTSASTMQSRIKNGEKRIPLMITFSMLFVVVLYITLTVIQLLRGTGTVADTLTDVFPKDAVKPIKFFVMLFVTISVFGTLNGFTFLLRVSLQSRLEDNPNFYFGLKVKNAKKFAAFLSAAVIIALAALSYIYGLFNDLATGKEAFASSAIFTLYMSDVIPIFSFFIYGAIVGMYLLKRKSMDHNKIKDAIFIPLAAIGSIMALLLMTYEMVYIVPIKPFVDGWTEGNVATLISFVFVLATSAAIGYTEKKPTQMTKAMA